MKPDFVELAHAHDSVSEFELAALEALQNDIGCDAAFFLTGGQEQHLTSWGLGDAARENLRIRSGLYAAELAAVKAAALGARGVAVDTAVLGEGRVREMHYYRDVARSVAGRHGLLAYLRKGKRSFGLVMLGRSSRSFSDVELERVAAHLPTLSLGRASFGMTWASGALPRGESAGPVARAKRMLTGVVGEASLEESVVVVRDRKNWREMVARTSDSELVWTRVDRERPSISGWPYVDLFHVAAAGAKSRRRALFLGCGGGVSPRQFAEVYPGIEIDIVEHAQPAMDLATRWFGLREIPGLSVHLGDGRRFVSAAAARSFDIVIVDLFDHRQVAGGVCDADFVHNLHRILHVGGTLGCNIIDSLSGNGPLRALLREIRGKFRDTRVLPVVDPAEDYGAGSLRNIVVVARAT